MNKESTLTAGKRRKGRTALGLGGTLLAVMLISGCAMAPGGHIDYGTEGNSLEDQVDVEPITPALIAAMDTMKRSARPVDSEFREQMRDYDYKVGPGDVLSVIVYDHPELTIPAGAERDAAESGNRVRPDGTMFYPYVGRIRVEGMTLEEVRSLLTRRLSNVISEPQVEVGMAAFRSQKVYVSGAVNNPGIQPVNLEPLTLLDAISQAGGATETADWHNVLLARDGVEENISLYALLHQGDMTQNRLLRSGDLVHVPPAENQNVVVLGQVLRPGAIAVGNERLTLTGALAQAGGVNESRAEPSGIFVIRGNEPGSEKLATVYQLDIADATNLLLGTRFALEPKDVVYVTSAPLARWNNVISLLLPSVTLPGDVGRSVEQF
ncbi:polysaccharide export protein [Litchfieldella xinjiangensis]|uniref:polysaccharide export protein n=1 Tax=Litchfieldella xinjiangensis TaxID=1166948 RepID=UPI0009DD37A8|nr:polysaccharide export protein [Halomonas xinjiangensis]